MENNEMVFRTCRNYKKGIYIFNAYKKSDFIILLSAISLGLFILMVGFRSSETARKSTYIATLVVALPAFLTLPLQGYHAMYYRLHFLIRRLISTNTYVWAGRKDRFEEIANEDI